MQKPVDTGTQTYWIEGMPAEGIRDFKALTGSQTYWLNGTPEENLFLLTNAETGKFFLLFE